MKTIIGIMVFMLVVSAGDAQTIHEKLIGTWKVIADTIGYNIMPTKANDKNTKTVMVSADGKKIPVPENDIWKFTKDTLYYTHLDDNTYLEVSSLSYTIKDSTVYCYDSPAYKIAWLTNTELVIKNDENSSGAAGLYIFPHSPMKLYLKRTDK